MISNQKIKNDNYINDVADESYWPIREMWLSHIQNLFWHKIKYLKYAVADDGVKSWLSA